ncbi:MAG: hypothetical protein M1819_004208 [Sarea resinae]|nr:MAG: hypothetical protein M1819_004208 [Sarea resinae]
MPPLVDAGVYYGSTPSPLQAPLGLKAGQQSDGRPFLDGGSVADIACSDSTFLPSSAGPVVRAGRWPVTGHYSIVSSIFSIQSQFSQVYICGPLLQVSPWTDELPTPAVPCSALTVGMLSTRASHGGANRANGANGANGATGASRLPSQSPAVASSLGSPRSRSPRSPRSPPSGSPPNTPLRIPSVGVTESELGGTDTIFDIEIDSNLNGGEGPDKVKRTVRACDTCRRKKIKCDAVKPACDGCRHANITCTYTRPHRKDLRKRKLSPSARTIDSNSESTSQVEQRLGDLEKLIGQFSSRIGSNSVLDRASPLADPGADRLESPAISPVPSKQASTPRDTHTTTLRGGTTFSFFKQHFESCKLDYIYSFYGVSFFSPEGQRWIQERTGETVDFKRFFDHVGPWRDRWRRTEADASPSDLNVHCVDTTLPDKELIKAYADDYFSSITYAVFPIIDITLFYNIIEAVYDMAGPDPHQFHSAGATACIHSFLAFASKFQSSDRILPAVDEARCMETAMRLLPELFLEDVTIEGLEAVLMLCGCQSASGHIQCLDMLISTASRMLFMLGGHRCARHQSSGPSPDGADSSSHLRILFWICYTVDKDLCLRTGRPPSMTDDECDLTFPSTYRDQPFPDTVQPGHSPGIQPQFFFPTDLRLAIIKSKAYNTLYSSHAMGKPDAELLRTIRELDEELDDWKLTLPPTYRPERSHVTQIPTHVALSTRWVLLHLEYYHCVNIIHRASTRCLAWINGTNDGVRLVNSSVEMCVEASRSTIYYLDLTQHLLSAGKFWFIVFYPVSSLVNIFCNLLQHPLGARAADDLHMICDSPNAITRIPPNNLSAGDVSNLRLILDFLMELKRLAKAAVDKAVAESACAAAVAGDLLTREA